VSRLVDQAHAAPAQQAQDLVARDARPDVRGPGFRLPGRLGALRPRPPRERRRRPEQGPGSRGEVDFKEARELVGELREPPEILLRLRRLARLFAGG